MKDYNSTFIAFLIFIFFSLLAWFAIAYFKEETKKEKTIYANEIEKGISAETAMIYTANGKSEISNSDSMFSST